MKPGDPLRRVIINLGSVEDIESELLTVDEGEITLTLDPHVRKVEQIENDDNKVLSEAKLCLMYVIRIQSGNNLLDMLLAEVTGEEETQWNQIKEVELANDDCENEDAVDLNLRSFTYRNLKGLALQHVLYLEERGFTSRENRYQELIDDMGETIRTKHARRLARRNELEKLRSSLSQLDLKQEKLREQLESYQMVIESGKKALQSAKWRRKPALPFSKQYFHNKGLEQSNSMPQFGSYRYTVQKLLEKGVIHSIDKNYDDRSVMTIMSDSPGQFQIHLSRVQGAGLSPGRTETLNLEDLLAYQ